MDAQLVETVTRILLGKMNPEKQPSPPAVPITQGSMVRVWDHLSDGKGERMRPLIMEPQAEKEEMIRIWDHVPAEKQRPQAKPLQEKEKLLPPLETRVGIDHPVSADMLSELVTKTPARIGIGRAGVRPKTEAWLRFRLDHAAAVDAVYGEVSQDLLDKLQLFAVETMVGDKEEYIRRPDLGRRLSEESKAIIRKQCAFQPQVQIIASDGLSSQAIEKNLEDVYFSLQESLHQLSLQQGTPFFIRKGRVAAMDDVGEILEPDVIVLLIGERPGLISAESLSAYLCYKPRKGTIEAERMVISNIHEGGIPPVEAGAYLGGVVQKILKYKASGISLVQQEG